MGGKDEAFDGKPVVSMIWFDFPIDISAQQSQELYDMVKKYQPNCLLNVGPDGLGRIPAPAEAILREVGKRLG